MISVVKALKGCHGQREQREQILSVWTQGAETPGRKWQGARALPLSPRKNFLNSNPRSKLGRREVVSVPSLEVCKPGLDDHFVEIQRVDGVVPWHPPATLS